MKNGRKRRFIPISGIESEIQQLNELHSRAVDLISDLPDDVRNAEILGHTMNRLYAHMIWAEDRLFGSINGDQDGDETLSIENLEIRTKERLVNKDLYEVFQGSRFSTIGEVFRHIQWHWSYHSGQMGLIRKQLGYTYKCN